MAVAETLSTPLHDLHVDMGARMVPFAGWQMPVQYSGIVQEHLHTRQKAGLFDICHMGEFYLSGPRALEDADRLVTCRVSDMVDGQARYGFLCNEEGGVLDDLIVFRLEEDRFLLVVNAGTREKDAGWIGEHLSAGTVFEDASDRTAKIDLQGPLSVEVLKPWLGDALLSDVGRFRCVYTVLGDVEVLLSRTGYTGERGYEIFFDAEYAGQLWKLLASHDDVMPVGLGARDSLRLEKGLPLYGHELAEDHTPLEAGLERFVDWESPFLGKKALRAQQAAGIQRKLVGFVCEGRRIARDGALVKKDGESVGVVTSGGFSPVLKRAIGMAYVPVDLAVPDVDLVLCSGKAEIGARTTVPPFV